MASKKISDTEMRRSVVPHIPLRTLKKERSVRPLRSLGFFTWSICLIAIGFAGSIWFGQGTSLAPTATVEGKVEEATPPLPHTYGEQPLLSIESFFAATREEFIEQKTDFIEADLASMKLSVYKGGSKVLEVPIQTKGKEGSWWETPAGVYAIQSKEDSHFSSFGHVYQPWSMAFQGNFFIHGWPHYPDGTPVASTYSGGCIRLSNEDAEKVYDLASVGMPILVHEQDYTNDSFSYEREELSVSAASYMVADLQSGAVLIEQGSDELRSIASVTKLLTALVAVEHINLDNTITITESMLVDTSVPRLQSGAVVGAYGLLFPLLKESSNEAAEALAQSAGRARFIERMNEKARAVGMTKTTFTDVSGADAGNISTAADLFHLARHLVNNRSFILDITSDTPVASAYAPPEFEDIRNFNPVPDVGGFVGGKVGKTTAAQETGVYLFRVSASGTQRTLVVIVLGSTDRNADVQTLLALVQGRYGISMSE